MNVRRKIRLGELLVQQQVISDQQLTSALAEQKRTGRKLGRVLADLGFLSESSLHSFLSRHLQVPFVDLKQVRIDREAVKLLPEPLARRYRALVLQQDAKGLLVGMADPSDLHACDELQARLRLPLRTALVGEADFLKTLDSVYRQTDEIASLAEAVRDDLKEGDVDLEHLAAEEGSPDAPVVRLLQSMFHDAMQARASDIHIEPGEDKLRIRLRVDGVLQEQVIEGRRVASALVTRLKLMCGLDIAEKRLPQDGRFSVRVRDAGVDVRLATMPTTHGESVVMRLLSQGTALLSLGKLGMPAATEERFRRLVERTAGMVLVTGPTGSGKTTTLYAALNHINRPGVKVITVEDPVEYRLDRITQVQVMPKIGLDFARVLRTALRQDPDIILVGEMRDRETVEIGLRGAMTGHFVFSTLHTINAIATVNRLLDMGAPGYMIAAAVHGVVAQRLVRRICGDCAKPGTPTPNQLAWLAACRPKLDLEQQRFMAGAGCTFCNLTGYRGRSAVYEILELDRPLADTVRRGDLAGFAHAARHRGGYVPLAQGAIDMALAGTTSLAEAMAVGSGLEELADSPELRDDDEPLVAAGIDTLLEQRG
ncbi:MAG: Flp pilus assembly complex ATPase component TadA [Gammaproteobacteria bacterium]|nr:Flp pilus assembly complex ATPase component TadA [Gammaproteobacteria bacterium]